MENLHPQIVRQVMREVVELSQNPPEGIKIILNEGDITDIQATIEGPGVCSSPLYAVGITCRRGRGNIWGFHGCNRARMSVR